MFYFGLVSGMAAVLLLNTAFVMSKGGLNLSQVGEAKAEIVAQAPTQPTAQQPTAPTPTAAPVKGIQATDHVRGNPKAKVVLIEYSDFQCPFCSKHHPVVKQLLDAFPNQIAWVYRHFPLTSIHPQAQPAAEASECAAEQGKFWEYADKLFDNQTLLGDATYEKIATDLELNVSKFKTCYSSKKYAGRVNQDATEGGAAGVDGTPANFINGSLVSGAIPFESLKAMVESQL